MPTYHQGSDGRAFVKPTVGSGPDYSELAVAKWDMEVDGDIKKFDNNKDGRWRQGGNVDATGSMSLHWDSVNRPSEQDAVGVKPNVRHGSIMDVELREDNADTTDPTGSWRLRVIIDKVKPSSDFDGTLDYDVTWMLQSGTIKYPGDA